MNCRRYKTIVYTPATKNSFTDVNNSIPAARHTHQDVCFSLKYRAGSWSLIDMVS